MENLIFNPTNQDTPEFFPVRITTSVQNASKFLIEEKNKKTLENSIIQKLKIEFITEIRNEIKNELETQLYNEIIPKIKLELKEQIQKEFELHGWETINHDHIVNHE